MRLKLFEKGDPALGVDEEVESTASFQDRVNAWLRKLQRHPEYRIVSQGVCVGSDESSLFVSIWYEKVPPKE